MNDWIFILVIIGVIFLAGLFVRTMVKGLAMAYRHNPSPEEIPDECNCPFPPSGRFVKVRTQLGGGGSPLVEGYRLIDRTCPMCGQWKVYAEQRGLPQGYKRWRCRNCGHTLDPHQMKERGMLREQIYVI